MRLIRALTPAGLSHVRDALAVPSPANVVDHGRLRTPIAGSVMVIDTLATSVSTVGVLAALCAGHRDARPYDLAVRACWGGDRSALDRQD